MRTLKTIGLVALFAGAAFVPSADAEIVTAQTPIPASGEIGAPTDGLTPAELDQWVRGRFVFDRDWRAFQGVGPDMNGDSCRACHQDGAIGGAHGIDVNVFRFARDEGGAGPFQDLPGGQIGSRIRHPLFPGREEHPDEADLFEQRNSPPLFGVGLIDQIADSTIFANEDPLDGNGDGIRGVSRLVDVGGVMECGKFGWKAQVPRAADFVFDAMGQELGITAPDNGRGFAILSDTDSVPDPELSDADFQDLLFFMTRLAAPPRAGGTSPLIALGEGVFDDVGCATCHIPELQGPSGPVPLYSNLLLHNVHPADFRGMEEPGAPAGFYRTPPLWGLRFSGPYMHDGSAETVLDAILAHTGEAEGVTQNFEALSAAEQDALLAFLMDL